MWTAFSAGPASSTSAGEVMMIGWATPSVAPLAGKIPGGGGPGGGGGGPGFWPAPGSSGGGSASAGAAPSTSDRPSIEASPVAFRAANICCPPVAFWLTARARQVDRTPVVGQIDDVLVHEGPRRRVTFIA